MKIPNRLVIGEAIYHVSFIPNLIEEDAGSCHQPDKLILVSTKQSRRELVKSFFHEWAHGVEEEYRLPLGHKRIEKLEDALAQLFEQICTCGKRR